MKPIVVIGILIFVFPLAFNQPALARSHASTETQQVDQLFSKWDKPDSPGAVVAVIKDGKTVYSRGYGLASLEYGVKNTPSTIFHVASDSKQFTAFAILLLEREGKLSLDDDIRKYLPKLHDFGKIITIRNLLNHTSGLRDQWALLSFAEWRLDDVITDDDVLNLIWRQKELNFPPGDQFLYSNTGYTLLGQIVAKISGQPLAQYAQEYIFKPLGMEHTHFQTDYGNIVKNRAYSYHHMKDGTYMYTALSYSTTGPTSLFTTVGDLARWDQNFYDGRVGGKDLIAEMQSKGHLNSGKEIDYAAGLGIGRYRGLDIIEHNGGDAGYNSDMLRFPKQRFSVFILANTPMNTTGLARKISDIYLAKMLSTNEPPEQKPERPEIKIDPTLLDAYVGDFAGLPGLVLTFTNEHGQLMDQATGQAKFQLFASSDNSFFTKAFESSISFDKPAGDGKVASGVFHQGGIDYPIARIRDVPLTVEQLKDYSGTYYSDELGATIEISAIDGGLSVRYARGTGRLRSIGGDNFIAGTEVDLHFTRDAKGACNGYLASEPRMRNLRFVKLNLASNH